MTMIRTLTLLLTAAAACSAAPSASAQIFDKDSVRCESKDSRRETCDTSWPGQTRLSRQLSDTACVQGRT